MIHLSKSEAAAYLLGHHRLNSFAYDAGVDGAKQMLNDLRCIQLDPLSPMGTSSDMVAIARMRHYRCGKLFQWLLPGHAFEHYAKERCLLPAKAFSYYQARSSVELVRKLPKAYLQISEPILKSVLREVEKRGPILSSEMKDYGRVTPMDWSGWKGTGKVATMALEILWLQCRIVVAGRKNVREKRYDLPERALGTALTPRDAREFSRWALAERVAAAGLLAQTSGPHWTILQREKKAGLAREMVSDGILSQVQIEGSEAIYYAPNDFLNQSWPSPDPHLRIIAPLDPFLWNRDLVRHVFGFEYVWEVYKPAKMRRWGWYVCPMLHRGRLVGRLEGRLREGVLRVARVWCEAAQKINQKALEAAVKRHARACGAVDYQIPTDSLS